MALETEPSTTKKYLQGATPSIIVSQRRIPERLTLKSFHCELQESRRPRFQVLLHNLTSLSELTRPRYKSHALAEYQRRKGIFFSNENSTHILNLRSKIFVTTSFSRSTENTKQVTASPRMHQRKVHKHH